MVNSELESQGEDMLSANESKKPEMLVQEKILEETEVTKLEDVMIVEKGYEESVQIADVKWWLPNYIEPYKSEIVQLLAADRKADQMNEETIPLLEMLVDKNRPANWIFSQIDRIHEEQSLNFECENVSTENVEAEITKQELASEISCLSNESRVNTFQEMTTTEELQEFECQHDLTEGQNIMQEYQSVVALLKPSVTKTAALTTTQLENFTEEPIAMASTEFSAELASTSEIPTVPLDKPDKSIGHTFVKSIELLNEIQQNVETIEQLQTETSTIEDINVPLEKRPNKQKPATWVFSKLEHFDEENAQQTTDGVPTPQNTTEDQIQNIFDNAVASKEQTNVSLVEEFHSEGEDDDMFLEAPEPSANEKEIPADACEKIESIQRQHIHASMQECLLKIEDIESGPDAIDTNSAEEKEIAMAFDTATKTLAMLSNAVIQEMLLALMKAEFIGESTKPVFGNESMIISDFLFSKLSLPRPSLVRVQKEQLTLLDILDLITDYNMDKSCEELIASNLETPRKEGTPVYHVISIVESISPEVIEEKGISEVSNVFPVPEIVQTEFENSEKADKLVSRAAVMEEILNLEKTTVIKAINYDDICMILPPAEIVATELSAALLEDQPVTRVQISELIILAEKVSEVGISRIDELAMVLPQPEIISVILLTHEATGRPLTRLKAVEDIIPLENISDEHATSLDELALILPAPIIVLEELLTAITESGLTTRALLSEKNVLLENTSDVHASNLDELALILPAPVIVQEELLTAITESGLTTRALLSEKNVLLENTSDVHASNLDELATILPAPLIVSMEFLNAAKESGLSTRAVLSELNLILEDISDRHAINLDELALILPAPVMVSLELMTASREGGPTTRAVLSETELILDKFADIDKTTLEKLTTFASYNFVQSTFEDSINKSMPIVQVLVLEERFIPDNFHDNEDLKIDEISTTLLAIETSPVDYMKYTKTDRIPSKVNYMENYILTESLNDNEHVSIHDLCFTIPLQLEKSIEFELAFKHPNPNFQTRILETRNQFENIQNNAMDSMAYPDEHKLHMTVTDRSEDLGQANKYYVEILECEKPISAEVESPTNQENDEGEPIYEEEIFVNNSGILEEEIQPEKSPITQQEMIEEKEIVTEFIYEEIIMPEKTNEDNDKFISDEWEETKKENFIELDVVDAEEPLLETRNDNITQCEILEEQEIVTESIYEEWEEVDKKELIIEEVDMAPVCQKKFTEEQEIVTESLFEEWEEMNKKEFIIEEVLPVEEEPICQKEITEEQEIVTESMYEEWEETNKQEIIIEQGSKIEEEPIYQKEITEEQEVVTESMYEEWEETNKQEIIIEQESKIAEEPIYQKEITEEQEIVTESMYEEWEETNKQEIIIEQEIKMAEEPIYQKEITEEQEIVTESMYEEWEVNNKTEFVIENEEAIVEKEEESDKESLFSTESMFEEWEVTTTTQTILEEVQNKSLTEVKIGQIRQKNYYIALKQDEVDSKDMIVQSQSIASRELVKEEETVTESSYEEWEVSSKTQSITQNEIITRTISKSEEETISTVDTNHYVPPSFDKLLSAMTVVDGSQVQFECHLLGYPRPTVQWFMNGEKIIAASDFEISYFDGFCRLKIVDVLLDDEGEYSVRATNEAGTCETSAYLKVLRKKEEDTLTESLFEEWEVLSKKETITENKIKILDIRTKSEETNVDISTQYAPPFFDQILTALTVVDGSQACLKCHVVGYPNPKIQWYLNGAKIEASADFEISYADGFCTLTITDVLIDDQGEYLVRATNEAGVCETSAYLTVLGKLLEILKQYSRLITLLQPESLQALA